MVPIFEFMPWAWAELQGNIFARHHVEDLLDGSGKVQSSVSQTQALMPLVWGHALGTKGLDSPCYTPEDFGSRQECQLPWWRSGIATLDSKVDREAQMLLSTLSLSINLCLGEY